MSAQCWMFDVNHQLPFWPSRNILIHVRYVGPDWENHYDPPSYRLLGENTNLEIYSINGIEDWCDQDAGIKNFYTELKTWISSKETELIQLIIQEFEDTNIQPDWYWDT